MSPRVYFGMPEGKDPVVETFLYATDIIEVNTGAEQRISVIEEPHRQVEFTGVEIGFRDAAGALNALMSPQQCQMIVPFWPEWTTLVGDLAAGAFSIPVDSLLMRRFKIGGYVCLWQNEVIFEAMLIADLGIGTITTVTATINAFTDGAVVIPAILGTVSDAIDVVSVADGGLTIGQLTIVELLPDQPTNEFNGSLPSLSLSMTGSVPILPMSGTFSATVPMLLRSLAGTVV